MNLNRRIFAVSILLSVIAAGVFLGVSSFDSARAEQANGTCFAKYNGAIETDLQTAINNAADGSTIQVSGTCYGTFSITTKFLTLEGGWNTDFTVKDPSVYTTTLDANGIFNIPVLTVENYGATLRNLIIKKGNNYDISKYGGGIHNAANLKIYESTFVSNEASFGGAIYNAGWLEIYNSYFSSNLGADGGGAIYNDGSTGNGVLKIFNSTIHNNQAGAGGGLYLNNVQNKLVEIQNSTFSSNSADDGGAIYNSNSSDSLQIINTVVKNNTAGMGGGIYNTGTGDIFAFDGSKIQNNTASSEGGGIYSDGRIVKLYSDVDLSGNKATGGGGGGIFSESSAVTVTQTTMVGNQAGVVGGGVYIVSGSLYMNENTLSGNSASFYGGGIYNSGSSVTIQKSTLSRNQGQNGGGIFNEEGVMLIENSTLSANTGTSRGGAVYNGPDGTLTLTFATLNENVGGGVFHEGTTTMTIGYSIIANSTGVDVDCEDNSGTITSSFNLIQDTPGLFCDYIDINSIFGQDPILGPLADNGGPTATHALLNGSPALEAAEGACEPSFDQRGVSRPQGALIGAGCDIGAYERADSDKPYRQYLPLIVKND